MLHHGEKKNDIIFNFIYLFLKTNKNNLYLFSNNQREISKNDFGFLKIAFRNYFLVPNKPVIFYR